MRSWLLISAAASTLGCTTLATSVATQVGVQTAGEQLLISQNKPVIKCNAINTIQGHKFCRVSRTYTKITPQTKHKRSS